MNITKLLARYDLSPEDVYLLELIPLIEMVWVDGRNQSKEMEIVYDITRRHIEKMNSIEEGVTVVSVDAAEKFLDRFLRTRPSKELLKELRELTIEWWKSTGKIEHHRDTVIDYCMDIAAACVASYPFEFDERINQSEKKLVKELVQALHIDV